MKVQNIKFANKPLVFRGIGEVTGDDKGVFDITDEKLAKELEKVGFSEVVQKTENKEVGKNKTPKDKSEQKSIEPEKEPEVEEPSKENQEEVKS